MEFDAHMTTQRDNFSILHTTRTYITANYMGDTHSQDFHTRDVTEAHIDNIETTLTLTPT